MTPYNHNPNLQPTQDVNQHTTPKTMKTKSTAINKMQPPRNNIISPTTMFDNTKQIIMDIGKLSHSTTIHNIILQLLYPNGLCKYDFSHQAYLFEHSNKPVNCSHILVFLKQSACYTVTPYTHQWYRINTNKITDSHNIAICNDTTINMVPLTQGEPSEFDAFETIARLAFSQNQGNLSNDTQTQNASNTPIIASINIGNTPKTNLTQQHNQSTIILQQFNMLPRN